MAAVAAPLVVNPRLHLRGDALSNTAIAHAILRHGIPPPDPYLAGQPLHYHWGYNAFAAGAGALLGVEPLTVMVVLGPVSLGVMLVGTVWLARRLAGGRFEGRWAALTVLLATVGLNGWGFAILLGRCAFGGASLADALGQGVHPFLRSVVAGYSELLGFLATKALVSTAFSWNMAFVVLSLVALTAYIQEGRWWQAAGFALAAALSAYANLFVGVVVLALVGVAAAVWALGYLRWGERERARRPLLVLAMAALAGAATAPYLLVTAGSATARESLVRLALPDAAHLLGFFIGLLPLCIARGLVARTELRGVAEAFVRFVTAGLAMAFLFTRVVDEVEIKLGFVVAVLMAVWVGSRAGELAPHRRRVLWWLAASCVPTTLLGLVAYGRAPEPARPTETELMVFEWMDRHVARDAVVVARERSTLVPVLAHRDLYVPDCVGFHRAARYDRAVWDRRSKLMDELFTTGKVREVLEAVGRELGRPVVLVTRRGDPPVADPRLRLLYRVDDMSVWLLPGEQ